MRIHLACVGMMCATYSETLTHRFLNPSPRFAELRSYFEWRGFTGHTLDIYGRPFFLDSGAFSAYSQGNPIEIEDYINFVKKYESQLDVYANLDAIPKEMTREARKVAAAETLKNQTLMEEAGLKPIPVFHMGEPWPYLKHYASSYDYMCIGGLVDTGAVDEFLGEIWAEYLSKPDGTPKLKVHGFGMTSLKNLIAYPWYSVDSSTWLIHSKYGIVAFPDQNPDGSWNYRTRPTLVAITEDSSLKLENGKHYDNMGYAQKSRVRDYIKQYGFTLDDLRGTPQNRFVVNLEYWINVENAINTSSVGARQFSLF